ncbi:MAG: AgmX/PglI C-terminal domain-containing protein [Bacteroidetes bacterium]|nr:AgmX/PglI C-terminal domain-containing protein [Bacteroidota bacterium]
MKNHKSGDQTQPNEVMQAVNPKATAVMAAQSRAFPDEFKQTFWEGIDKRYAGILLATFGVVYGAMFTMLLTYEPPDQSAVNEMIKQAFMQKILKRSAALELDTPKEEIKTDNVVAAEEKKEAAAEKATTKGKTREEATSEEFKQQRAEAAAAAKAQYQANVAAQASAAIAALAGRSRTGRASSAGTATDVLSSATSTGDLGAILKSGAGQQGMGFGNATREDVGRGGAVGAKLGAVGAARGLGAGTGVGDALGRSGNIKSSLSTGKIKSSGSSSRGVDELTSVIDEHSRAITACYEQEKVKDPSLRGQIVVELRISPDGRVVGPRIASSTMKNANVERCILNKVRLWQFSTVTDKQPQVLNIPYVFAD